MGLFPFARAISSRLNPTAAHAACIGWPEVRWPGHASPMLNCSSVYPLRLFSPSQPGHIQHSSAAKTHHRSMIRTVERSPPLCVSDFSPAAPHQLAVE